MKLVLIVGSGAVGKMTVGQELMKITDLRLFHNHMMIEPVIDIFGYFKGDTILKLREIIFDDFTKSDCYGMIHTLMWAFDMESDWEYVENLVSKFDEVYCIELIASQEVRLERNKTENRLINKPSKRDIEASDKRVLKEDLHRLVSNEGEIPFKNYLRINNENIEAKDVAKMIKEAIRTGAAFEKFKDEYELESSNKHLLSATMPSDLAKGLASANGYNILNSNGYNGENTGVINIFNQSLDLFYNYYKYSNNDVLRFYEPLISIYNNSYKLSPFICDNTIVSGNLYSLSLLELGLMNKSTNDLKWQLIPYPSNNYENYTSFLDEYNQVGFTIVGKHYYNDTLVNSFNDKFTKEVAFEILYDLYDGYYQEYESVQEQNIKEFLGKYLTLESIDLFFELNKNKSLEAINILVNHSYNQVTQDFNVSSLKELNSLPLDGLLLMNEWYVEAYFNNEVVNYQNKFN